MPFEASCDPTEKIIHEEPHDDHWGTWNDLVFINGSGPKKGIGISDGCVARVYPIKGWLELEEKIQKLEEENKEAKDIIRQYGAAVMLGECPKRTWSVFKQASKFLSETQEKK